MCAVGWRSGEVEGRGERGGGDGGRDVGCDKFPLISIPHTFILLSCATLCDKLRASEREREREVATPHDLHAFVHAANNRQFACACARECVRAGVVVWIGRSSKTEDRGWDDGITAVPLEVESNQSTNEERVRQRYMTDTPVL